MERTFDELTRLLTDNPLEYRARLERLRSEDPALLEAYVERMRSELELANAREDRPLTDREVEDMIDSTAKALGWSRHRVLAEAVLRLRGLALYGVTDGFTPVTPEVTDEARAGRYVRRHSSIRALALGEVRALRARPGVYRCERGAPLEIVTFPRRK